MYQLTPFSSLLLFTYFLLPLPSSIARADWPEFRGPNQNGTITLPANATVKLPLEWADEDPAANSPSKNILWKTPTTGLGWSSPVIVEKNIYITSARPASPNADPKDLSGPQSLYVSCYNLADGTLLFDKKIFEQPQDAPAIHKKNSHASPTILAHRPPNSRLTRLYVHFGHQGTACLSTQGEILWTNTEHNYPPVHGNGSSPIAHQDKIILTIDGAESPYTLALDAMTGKEAWKTPRNVTTDRSFSFATAQSIEVNGKTQIISPGADIVQALDPVSGNVLWFVRYSGYSLIVRPIYHQGLVFISTGYNTPKLLAIDPTGQGDVTDSHVRWTTSSGVPNTPSLTPMNNQIIMVSDGGVATGLKASDGTKLWQKRLGGNFSASPLAIGNRIYFQNEAGEAIIMELPADENSPENTPPTELARNTLPGRAFASYAVDQDDLIIRTEHALYRISNSTTP
jgi:outer membrane protein assembly factor BamB